MPLYKSINVSNETHVLIWQITESETELKKGIILGDNSKRRLSGMKSEMHRRAYLSVRHLLAIAQYVDEDMTYNSEGKPCLSDGVYISVTHSYNYAAIILSGEPVGIDVEKQRDKIERIAHKFVSDKEFNYLNKEVDHVRMLTVLWGAKESLYKLLGKTGLSFKQHIEVAPFDIGKRCAKAAVYYEDQLGFYDLDFVEFDDFTCVYGYLSTN